MQLYLHRARVDRTDRSAAAITSGQNTSAVVILTPAVGGAAYPTGTVTLTDALTSTTYTPPFRETPTRLRFPAGLAVGTHTFTAPTQATPTM